jgi:2-polyprenyl-6-methoxyphenol hydroxylase-like FAD-dependent oxidoreductase
MDTDVLIIGAGPTGLMLANQLGRRGIRTIIIDRHAGPSLQTRALGVQARTLEIYDKLGIADRALELGKRATGANIWSGGEHKGRVPLGAAGNELTAFPFILVLGQDANERIMGDKLKDWNLAVTWNTELTAIEQHADHVKATLRGGSVACQGEVRTIAARWVAGCDGARSAVREFAGITFPGAPYEHVFFVADTQVTGNMITDEVNVYLWKDGFHLFFPMQGANHWRVVGILPANLQHKAEATFEDVAPSIRDEVGAALNFTACSWFSTYRIHHRSAAQFRANRCFVLGDAAHIHSPMGAQGMNTGLQDAYNLAWKLALVVKGQASEALLDSYEQERLPLAQQLLNTTDRAFRLVVSDSWLAGVLRTKVIARIAATAMSNARIQRMAFRAVSQIAIQYRRSGLSKSKDVMPKKAPQAGDRFPWLRLKLQSNNVEDLFGKLDDTQFNLLLFGQTADKDIARQLGLHGMLVVHNVEVANSGNATNVAARNHAALTKAHIPLHSFYLLRPDGHIAYCGIEFDATAVRHYVTKELRVIT